MEIPKALSDLADRLDRARLEEKRVERKEERDRIAAAKLARERRVRDGLEDAQFLIAWAKEFRATPTGKRLIRIGGHTFMNGMLFFAEKVNGRGGRGLGVSRDGLWYMRFGCGARPEPVSSAEELAAEIEPEILAQAKESILSGRVWSALMRRCEELQ